MKIRVFDDRVVIRQTEASQESNGVLVPDQSQVAPAEGWVVAVGPGVIKAENLQLSMIFKLLKSFFYFIAVYAFNKGEHWDAKELTSEYNPMQIRVGDYVIFGKYAGTKIKYDGQEYIMVRQSDCFMADETKVKNP